MAPGTELRNMVRLPRDNDVGVFSNDYSVDPPLVGRIVDVVAELATAAVTHEEVIIAPHARVWAGQTGDHRPMCPEPR